MRRFEKDREIWENLAETDALWSILTEPETKGNKWEIDAFFKTGEEYASKVFSTLKGMNSPINYEGTVLDFGCGVGRLTVPLAKKFKRAIGVDVSPTMISKAKAYHGGIKKCSFIVNETDNLKIFSDNSFSMVFSIITLQHIEKKYALKYIKEFIRISEPGGLIHFQLPVPQPIVLKGLKVFIRDCLVSFRNIFSKSKECTMHHYGVEEKAVVNVLKKGSDIIKIDRVSPLAGFKYDRRYYAIKR